MIALNDIALLGLVPGAVGDERRSAWLGLVPALDVATVDPGTGGGCADVELLVLGGADVEAIMAGCAEVEVAALGSAELQAMMAAAAEVEADALGSADVEVIALGSADVTAEGCDDG